MKSTIKRKKIFRNTYLKIAEQWIKVKCSSFSQIIKGSGNAACE